MAKKARYPRKLRHTLEKIAEARDERAAAAEEDELSDPFRVLWQAFLPRGSAHLMSVRIDEVRNRLVNTIMMEPQFRHPRVFVTAPWVPKREGSAS